MDQPTQEFSRPPQPRQQPPSSQQTPYEPQRSYDQPTYAHQSQEPQPSYDQPSYEPQPFQPSDAGQPPPEPPPKPKRRSLFRDPLSITLIVVIVLALIGALLVGFEWYVRNAANDKIRAATACEIKDSEDTVDVSFSTVPPVLWQYLNDKYTRIQVTTSGTHIRSAEGMTLDVVVEDLDADARTIGAIDGKVQWTVEGIQQTMEKELGWADFVVGSVDTDPVARTITVSAALGLAKVTVEPKVDQDGGLRLEITESELGFGLLSVSREEAQQTLDDLTGDITKNELGVKLVEPIEITEEAVTLRFAAQDSTIPESDDPDSCFANL
jgi:hypothetical protein